MWPADERRSARRYNTIAAMCKHRRAGEVGLMINSKEMVFRHSPCFYSNPEDRAGLVSTGAWATFQSAPHAFLSPILRQKQKNIFESCSKDQGCFANTIKQCVCLDFALFPIKKHLLHNQTKNDCVDWQHENGAWKLFPSASEWKQTRKKFLLNVAEELLMNLCSLPKLYQKQRQRNKKSCKSIRYMGIGDGSRWRMLAHFRSVGSRGRSSESHSSMGEAGGLMPAEGFPVRRWEARQAAGKSRAENATDGASVRAQSPWAVELPHLAHSHRRPDMLSGEPASAREELWRVGMKCRKHGG